MKKQLFTVFVILTAAMLLLSPGVADAKCVKRSLTAGEQAYYEQVTSIMETALPAPDSWIRQVIWMNVPKTVCEGFEENPILFGGQFKFVELTELDRLKEEKDRRQNEMEEKVREAMAREDRDEVVRLQGEMQRVVSEGLENIRKAQVDARSGPKPDQIIAKFRVNEKRKAVGKKLDISAMPHTAKTFERVNGKGTDRESITKMLYIGRWRVEDFIKNWNLFRPEAPYDKLGSLRLELTGKRQQVEAYISHKLDMGLLDSASK